MSAVLHLPVLNTQNPYMLKDKAVESFAPAFTAVNGRGSPPTPRASTSTVGVSARVSPSQYSEQRPSESEHQSCSPSSSPDLSSGESSPESPKKRKRTESIDGHSAARGMDTPPNRALPPIDRGGEHERRWTAEPQTHNGYQEVRDPRPMEPLNGSLPPMAAPHAPQGEPSGFEPGSSTDASRAGVQQHIDAKKRKRQFANRTKTGCGTCRRRKKKCDEAKPECNNCTRGGFVCEGYASKIPWPKNGITKPPPPLQAKEHMSHDPTAAYPRCPGCNQIHIPHCEPTRSSSLTYSDPRTLSGSEGARVRPIVVEDQERKPPAQSGWTNGGWNEPPRTSYPEHSASVPAPHSQPPVSNPDRTPSHDHHMPQPQGGPPPLRQHNPRVYHHTPQSMSHPASHTPALADAHHQAPQQARQPPLAPPTSAPPAPPQSHYAPPPRAHKTEKEKMLNGEPFLPNDEQLMDERAQCTGAVYSFNSTANPSVVIARGDRERHFKRIVAAGWIHPRHMDRRPGAPIQGGHLGGNVNVTTPFHCDYGYNISIGDNVNIGPHCQLLDSARIAIGRNTKIGARVTISTLKTPTDVKTLKGSNGTELAREVYIGENVYIGDGVIIEAGVKIGNNAIIRAGSVVVRDIACNLVAYGNPAFG